MNQRVNQKIKLPAISGPGLKKEGVVVLQTLFIALFTFLELSIRSGAGFLSGIVLVLVTFGGIAYGRPGTRYVSAVTPPLAYAATALSYIIISVGFDIPRIGVDFIASLASVAPYMLVAAIYGWFQFLNEKAKKRPSKRKAVR